MNMLPFCSDPLQVKHANYRGLSPLLCYKISLQAFFRQDGFWNPDFSVLVYTSLVNFMGLYSLQPQYYISLFAVEASYLGLMTVAEKNLHKEKQDFVLKRGKATVIKKKLNTSQSQGNLLASL